MKNITKKNLQRMLQLADIKPIVSENKVSISNFELVKNSANGNTYAIVRENKKYFIKQSQTKENLVESDFDYVGGVANKMKKSFHSFSDATKHLNLMFEEINNHYDTDSVNLLESDAILSEKKFVLKLNKKKPTPKPEEAPAEEGEESLDFGEEDTEEGEDFDFGGEEEDTEGEEGLDLGGEEEDTESEEDLDLGGEEEDTESEEDLDFGDEEGEEDIELDDSEDEIKDIQSTTGKLGQQLRDVEDLSSDMQKWVAKSVLSALDLDNMESEDKKDLIRAIKKKSEKEEEEGTEEEGLDFGSEEENVEESYDSYMEDEDPFDGMDKYLNPTQERRARYFSDEDIEDVDSEFPSHREVYGDSEENVEESYDSYMTDGFNERSFNSWMKEMEELGITKPESNYNSYMRDTKRKYEDNPNIGGDEDVPEDKLLLDTEYQDPTDYESEALYGPNTTNRYSRSNLDRAKRQANKDISSHFYKAAAPGYEERPSDDWAKYRIPYETKFSDETQYMTEDHFNDRMETYEQERAYEDVEKIVRRYGMELGWCHKETTEDPEESIIYLDIKDGDKKLLKVRINSVGSIEVGEMKGKNFVGEPVDSVEDFIEIFGEDLTSKEKDNLNMDTMMSPQPAPSKPTPSKEPGTQPGRPEKRPGTDRPSRRPFTPPPHITPGEEPGPKARGRRSYMSEDDMDPTMAPSPAPSKPTPSKEPDTKPGKPEKRPGTDRPSRRPFTPPPHITPGEEPGPKAGYEDYDVEFE